MFSVEYFFFPLSVLLGFSGAWCVGRWGFQLGLKDIPNERSSHKFQTPKGGGIGILAAFVLGSLLFDVPQILWVPGTLVSILGLITDRYNISPQIRLIFQFIASIVIMFGIIDSGSREIMEIAFILFCVVFIVGTTNFYNFMDGINGIAAITGIIGYLLLGFSAYLSGFNFAYIALAICISLACAGFLPFNMPVAKVFMGDVGSLLLGFVFASIVVLISKNFINFIVNTSFLFPFYADELTTMTIRIRDGEKLTEPHRRHLYQILANEYRISHWKVSLGYGLFQLLIGISVLLLRSMGLPVIFLMLTCYFLSFLMISKIIRKKLK